MTLFDIKYSFGKLKGNENQILRNVNSSSGLTKMICFLSNSDHDSEWYSISCDDWSSSELCSKMCDMLLFRVQERWQVSAARLYPRIFVLVEFQIRDAVN